MKKILLRWRNCNTLLKTWKENIVRLAVPNISGATYGLKQVFWYPLQAGWEWILSLILLDRIWQKSKPGELKYILEENKNCHSGQESRSSQIIWFKGFRKQGASGKLLGRNRRIVGTQNKEAEEMRPLLFQYKLGHAIKCSACGCHRKARFI